MARTVRALQGDTIDAICWREYGRTQGVTEAVLTSNTGLAAGGPMIPQGTLITLPEVTETPTTRPTINLWD